MHRTYKKFYLKLFVYLKNSFSAKCVIRTDVKFNKFNSAFCESFCFDCGGKVGRKLVEDFNYEGDDVVLIDIKSEICDRIQDDYDVRCVCGSGTDLEALREAEANKADIFIAVTENDELTHFVPLWLKNSVRADVLQE